MNRGLIHTKQVRRCVACRECKHQCEMIRLTKFDNQIYIDKKNSLGGRGAYVCKNEECIKLAVKKKLFTSPPSLTVASSTLSSGMYDIRLPRVSILKPRKNILPI